MKEQNMKKLLTAGALGASLLLPLLVGAQIGGPTLVRTSFGFSDLTATIRNLTNALTFILFAVAIIFFLLAGFNYLTAAGSEEKVKTAHKQLIYGLVALAVGIVARGLIFIVVDVIGV